MEGAAVSVKQEAHRIDEQVDGGRRRLRVERAAEVDVLEARLQRVVSPAVVLPDGGVEVHQIRPDAERLVEHPVHRDGSSHLIVQKLLRRLRGQIRHRRQDRERPRADQSQPPDDGIDASQFSFGRRA